MISRQCDPLGWICCSLFGIGCTLILEPGDGNASNDSDGITTPTTMVLLSEEPCESARSLEAYVKDSSSLNDGASKLHMQDSIR